MQGRYEIRSTYFGLFDDERVIAVTDNIVDAKFVCDAMNKALSERPFVLEIRKVADDYIPELDDDESLFTLFDVIDTPPKEGGDRNE